MGWSEENKNPDSLFSLDLCRKLVVQFYFSCLDLTKNEWKKTEILKDHDKLWKRPLLLKQHELYLLMPLPFWLIRKFWKVVIITLSKIVPSRRNSLNHTNRAWDLASCSSSEHLTTEVIILFHCQCHCSLFRHVLVLYPVFFSLTWFSYSPLKKKKN